MGHKDPEGRDYPPLDKEIRREIEKDKKSEQKNPEGVPDEDKEKK